MINESACSLVHLCWTVSHKFSATLHLPLAICSSSPDARAHTSSPPSACLFTLTLFHTLYFSLSTQGFHSCEPAPVNKMAGNSHCRAWQCSEWSKHFGGGGSGGVWCVCVCLRAWYLQTSNIPFLGTPLRPLTFWALPWQHPGQSYWWL